MWRRKKGFSVARQRIRKNTHTHIYIRTGRPRICIKGEWSFFFKVIQLSLKVSYITNGITNPYIESTSSSKLQPAEHLFSYYTFFYTILKFSYKLKEMSTHEAG